MMEIKMLRYFKNNRGYSLVEVLIAVVIGLSVLGAVLAAYTGSLRVFKDVKSISDNIETKTPSIELIARYFDRWGVGVVSREAGKGIPNCANCPPTQKTIIISNTNDCSDVTFFGNLYGFGFVRDVVGTANDATKLISCRLDRTETSSTKKNCYTLWRDNSPLNDLDTSNNLIPLALRALSSNNADCSQLPVNVQQNATMDDEMSPWSGSIWKTVRSGDVIQRAAHKIRLYCQNNPSDNNRKWLYVDLRELYGNYCNENENASPIAPVEEFKVEAIVQSPLPPGTTCSTTTGGTGCGAIKASVTFRSQSKKYGGQFDTFTVTKVFGR
jgi:prepilin-type N-terminal cleavage/methylation domain-containing protein